MKPALFNPLRNLQKSMEHLFSAGLDKEPDKLKQKYIRQFNIMVIIAIVANIVIGSAYLFYAREPLIALTKFSINPFLLILMVLVRKGSILLAKIFFVLLFNVAFLSYLIVFNQSLFLDPFFFMLIIISPFVFHSSEQKWHFFCVTLTAVIFLFGETQLNIFLPDLNLLKNINEANTCLLISEIIGAIFYTIVIIKNNWQYENLFMNKKNQLLESKHLLELQNNDLRTFALASSNSLQKPLQESKNIFQTILSRPSSGSVLDKKNKEIQIIKECFLQMDDLITGLLSYNQVVHINRDWEQLDLHTELQQIKEKYEKINSANRIDIYTNDSITINTNKMLLEVAMNNIVENGLKYNTSDHPAITIHTEKDGHVVKIIFTDNGIGIPEALRENIFLPFKRLNADKYKGNGLGLTVSRRAIEKLNGRLYCEKGTTNGTTFFIELPQK